MHSGIPSLVNEGFFVPESLKNDAVVSRFSLCRHLLLWPAEHQEERLHGPAAEHAGLRFHAGAARPVTGDDEGQHVADQLVQQGPLQVPHQQLLPDKAR